MSGWQKDAGPGLTREVIAQKPRTGGQAAQDGANAPRHVVARHLPDLDVHVHAAEVACFAAVQEVAEGDEGGGLAGLPRGVQYEVAFRPDQGQQLFRVHPLQG